ncbi:MAG: hypothetical protein NC924_06535 [Candidatus Omnitrophica bacterium]|nr:hypothetical protein [Candidatus Omnitrophota bacterium]
MLAPKLRISVSVITGGFLRGLPQRAWKDLQQLPAELVTAPGHVAGVKVYRDSGLTVEQPWSERESILLEMQDRSIREVLVLLADWEEGEDIEVFIREQRDVLLQNLRNPGFDGMHPLTISEGVELDAQRGIVQFLPEEGADWRVLEEIDGKLAAINRAVIRIYGDDSAGLKRPYLLRAEDTYMSADEPGQISGDTEIDLLLTAFPQLWHDLKGPLSGMDTMLKILQENSGRSGILSRRAAEQLHFFFKRI